MRTKIEIVLKLSVLLIWMYWNAIKQKCHANHLLTLVWHSVARFKSFYFALTSFFMSITIEVCTLERNARQQLMQHQLELCILFKCKQMPFFQRTSKNFGNFCLKKMTFLSILHGSYELCYTSVGTQHPPFFQGAEEKIHLYEREGSFF